MTHSKPLGLLALAALMGAAPAFAQTSGASAQSSATTQNAISEERAGSTTSIDNSANLTSAPKADFGPPAPKPLCGTPGKSASALDQPRDCIAEPFSGVSTPGVANNALDASGTFSSSPALSPTPGVGVDANVSSSSTTKP